MYNLVHFPRKRAERRTRKSFEGTGNFCRSKFSLFKDFVTPWTNAKVLRRIPFKMTSTSRVLYLLVVLCAVVLIFQRFTFRSKLPFYAKHVIPDSERLGLALWKEIVSDIHPRVQRRLLIVRVHGGLGNRLRVLSSSIVTAATMNRLLVFVWDDSLESHTHFTTIFQELQHHPVIPRNLSITHLSLQGSLVGDIEDAYHSMCSSKTIPVTCVPANIGRLKCSSIQKFESHNAIYLETSMYVSAKGCLGTKFERSMANTLRSLILSSSARKFIRKYSDINFRDRLGVHIRLQDDDSAHIRGIASILLKKNKELPLTRIEERILNDTNVGSEDQMIAYRKRRKACNYNAFAKNIIDKLLTTNYNGILLSCDVQNCAEKLRKRLMQQQSYSKLMHQPHIDAHRSSEELIVSPTTSENERNDCFKDSRSEVCQLLALTDIVLLSKTKEVFPSRFSSFSDMAFLMRHSKVPTQEDYC